MYKIICPFDFRRILCDTTNKRVKDFTLDLGMKYTSIDMKGNIVPNITDFFVTLVKKEYSMLANKIGNYGSIEFYSSVKIHDNQIIVYDCVNKKFYNLEYNIGEANANPEKYLADLIRSIIEEHKSE